MNQRLERALKEAFPNVFKTAAPCVGDGWFLILWNLCGTLEPLGVTAAQVKEKFGGLRFYLNEGGDEARAAIHKAEEQSNITCENCGRLGGHTSSLSGWMKTLCAPCDKS